MRIVSLLSNSVKFSIGSKRSLFLAVIAVSIAALAFVVHRFAPPLSSASGLNSGKPNKQQGCCNNASPTLRRMIGTYYTTENNFKSTLVLNNKGPNQIVVTPILHSQNGKTFTASPIAVGGESSSEVDLNALASIAGPQFRSGSFEFTYEGQMLEMGGGLRIVDAEKSLIFDEQMLEPGMKFPASQLETVYALPFDSAKVSVIVTNTTSQLLAVQGQATFAGSIVRFPVIRILRPHETSVVDLPPGIVKKAGAGAVSINHNGLKGALLAMIHLQDADRGYSESVSFTNPGAKTTERQGAGLRLGSVNNDPLKPVIAVRNIGDSATTVTATVPYSKQNGDTGTLSLPQVSLAPGEIKLLNTSNPRLKQNDFATAGLEIKYTGAPGSVIASATTVSQSGDHVFALPMKDPQGGLSSTGGYPWFINGSSSTVVFIKNTTNEPQQFHLDIVYPGGRWGSNLKTLAPGQTTAFDIRKIRDAQEVGSEGNTIPPDAATGHIAWKLRGVRDKVLIGRAQTVDLVNGLASTYECQCTCGGGFYEARLLPGSVTGVPGDTTSCIAQQRDSTCNGGVMSWYNVGVGTVSFSSDNTSVATIDSSGVGAAVAPGATNLRATWETGIWYFDALEGGCRLEPRTANGTTSCTVAATWTLGEVVFNSPATASPTNPGVLKVSITEGQGMPTSASITLVVSFALEGGGEININIDPSQKTISGTNPATSQATNQEILFKIPINQTGSAATVRANAKLQTPTGGSAITGMDNRSSSNTLIANKQ